MDLKDKIKVISSIISEKRDSINTEEATKTAFVLRFIDALGYDFLDPNEVIPEFIADWGGKKGEKVDYAIVIDDKPAILMECKSIQIDLDNVHASQLRKYFTATEAKFGILTNGIIYRFYTDIEKPNIMDKKPFFEMDLTRFKEADAEELKQFTKEAFDPKKIAESASELKYIREMKKIMAEQLKSPSEGFVRFFAKKVHTGQLNRNAKVLFTEITKSAFNQFIKEKVDERLEIALNPPLKEDEPANGSESKTVTTKEEWEGYYIVKSILSELIDPERVTIRDRISYCGILIDNNQNKVVCRMHFNSKQNYLGFFDKKEKHKSGAKKEDKIPIDNVSEIYKHAERLRNTAKIYISDGGV